MTEDYQNSFKKQDDNIFFNKPIKRLGKYDENNGYHYQIPFNQHDNKPTH